MLRRLVQDLQGDTIVCAEVVGYRIHATPGRKVVVPPGALDDIDWEEG